MRSKSRILFVVLATICIANTIGYAQVSNETRQLQVTKTSTKIIIDGQLQDDAWQTATIAEGFINKWPIDSGQAKLQTIVQILYDEQFLYFGIKAFLADKEVVLQSLKRDVNPYYSDGVSIVLDPSGKNTSGYTFGVNAAGAQMEGIVEVNSASFDWDTKWFSATKIFKDYWTAEIAIPFKSLRFPKGKSQWGINMIRNDMTNNSFSTWNRVPIQFFGANLNYLGRITFSNELPSVKRNYAVIPYVSGKIDEQEYNYNTSANAGLDAKLAINSSLNLDVTVNPDFSQVDVDRQIINLDRFNVLLPERRTFFLENSDLFASAGIANVANPFVSRRIGLTDDGRVVPIHAGVRLTGNINPALRIGIMNIQSAAKYELPAQNFTIAGFDHKIFKRSNLRAMVTNRQETRSNNNGKAGSDYNRVAGAEFNFLSNNTKFNGRAGYYQSFNPGKLTNEGFAMGAIGYTGKNITVSLGWHKIDPNFIADLGFTPRLYNYDAARDTIIRIGYHNYSASFDYFIYPKSKKLINSIDLFVKANDYTGPSGSFVEFNGLAGIDILFAHRQEAVVSWTQQSVNLPFATSLFAETGVLAKKKYDFGFIQVKYLSNFLRPFSWGLTVESGTYYNGNRTTIAGSIKYRAQPWGNFGVDIVYNRIRLNEKNIYPYIIGPTVEFAFSNKLFWTTFLQYNTFIKNVNANSRFQWRFKPMSDIFIVYTDNYITDGFLHKTRSLVVKASYWIN